MGLIYRILVRPMLRFQDSENAHIRSLKLLRIFSSNFLTRRILSLAYYPRKSLPISVFGYDYKHPFGLAAGMDKKAESLRGWETIGLAFAEIGGVTMLEQAGNPKPRMFRCGSQKALVNRMGFNNPGSEKVSQSLSKYYEIYGAPECPIWVNIGKSKVTNNDEAHLDYSTTLERLWSYGDVFVINVSSPNTPNLRDLQNQDELKKIIEACMSVNIQKSSESKMSPKHLLVKVAPDMRDEQLESIVSTAISTGCSGIVATNTTVSRPDNISNSESKIMSQTGGMSGAPLNSLSTDFISKIYKMTDGQLPIVGVGGIMNANDAWEKITAGATLLQAYSGFVFEGPALTKIVVNGLAKKLREHNLSSIEQAVGIKHHGGVN